MHKYRLRKLILAALFLALGTVLPTLTGQIKEIGDSLLPMHFPVLLCGLLCGAPYGLTVGLFMPFVRSLTFGMPPLYPNAVWMALELATYGLVIGFLYARAKKKTTLRLYFCLVCSMLLGRIVWGISKAALLGIADKTFTVKAFIAGGFIDALPGIVLQLVLIPLMMKIIDKIENSRIK